MRDSITWVGIDDHKRELVVAVLRGREKEPEVSRVANEDRALRRWVRRLLRESGEGEIRMCYEAGPNGFSLKRRLESQGPVVCEVIAPSLTPRRSGVRVKTDRRDAGALARLYRAGELTEIGVPGEEDEAARDLTRLHHQVSRERVRKQHHILKFLLRRGCLYEGSNWTRKHRDWMKDLKWEHEADRDAFDELLSGLRELESRTSRLDAAVGRLAQEETRALVVSVLRCFHGIDTVAAVSLVTEIFRIDRFPTPRDLMGYIGITSSVRQTGAKNVRGPITKAGNGYVRWLLVQIAWHYRHRPGVGGALRRRRKDQSAWAIEIADRAHHRLHHRYVHLLYQGKVPQVATVAVARELLGFIWEALIEAERRHGRARGAA
jgi:transposase